MATSIATNIATRATKDKYLESPAAAKNFIIDHFKSQNINSGSTTSYKLIMSPLATTRAA